MTVVLGDAKNPKLPPGVMDAIFLLDVYHELEEYPDMLKHIHATVHGFTVVHREDRFLDHPDDEGLQWLLVAERKR